MPREYSPTDEDDDDFADDSEFGEEDDTISCPHCGAEIYDDTEHCPRCERYLSREELGSRRPLWFTITAVVCLIVTIVGALSGAIVMMLRR